MELRSENQSFLKGKTLLITGGTGSFGYAVLKRLLTGDIGEIRIFSRDEKKQEDMRQTIRDSRMRYYIGDVRDYRSIVPAMKNAHYVFHAAALKQVPSCELFPIETYKTNVLGTLNVLDCAIENRVEKVICLSSDKAVYPINVMGISKAMMEKLMLSKSRDQCGENPVLCATRFGNLLLSRGSVVPIFLNQIRNGLPLTITNAAMTRYLMTMDEAVDLILFAFEHAGHGDILVRKSPAAAVGDLAQAMLELCHADNPVKIIGIRFGEKMHEMLLNHRELLHAEDMGEYYRIPVDASTLNCDCCDAGIEETGMPRCDYDSLEAIRMTVDEIKKTLMNLEEFRLCLKGCHAGEAFLTR